MKKIIFSILIIVLIFFTSIIKNSTKDIDAKIFNINEDIKLLKEKYELVLLETPDNLNKSDFIFKQSTYCLPILPKPITPQLIIFQSIQSLNFSEFSIKYFGK